MENEIFTKSDRLTAKKNFLALEANYRFVKKLANKSSNAEDYNALQTANARSFLSGWSHALGDNFEGKIFTYKYSKDKNDNWKCSGIEGCIPYKDQIANLNLIYYNIKHNKFEELSNCYHGLEIAEYLINPKTNITYQFID